MGGIRHFAEIDLTMEPILDGSQGVELVLNCNDEAFLPDYKNIILESLREETQGGGQLGFPLISTRLIVTCGRFSETDTTEPALRIAASDAYRKALEASGIVLLEPIMKMEISTPDEYVGDIVSDINQRRGIVTQTHNRGKLTIVEAETPLSNLFGYSSAMLSLTKGRASSSMEPFKYRPAPPDVLKSFML